MTNIQFIKAQVSTTEKAIENTLTLLSEGCTIPFIARYRKDRTGNLDEVAIEKIAKAQADYENICKRKETILSSVEEQGKLTEELRKRIEASYELTELEDLYLPYKKKRKTKGDV
ncbi:Tex-like N-terminal domain-containing protein, partial [Capnocytophaga gingivalis]